MPAETGTIGVLRRTVLQDLIRRHTVYVDDEPVARLWAFQSGIYETSAGMRRLQLGIVSTGTSSSAEIEVDVRPGETRTVRTRSRGFKGLATLPIGLVSPEHIKGPWIVLQLQERT